MKIWRGKTPCISRKENRKMENLETELRYRFYDRSLPFTIGDGEIQNNDGDTVGIISHGETLHDYALTVDTLATIKPCFRGFDKLVTDISPSFIQLDDDFDTMSFDIRDSEHIQITYEALNRRCVEMFKENSVFYADSGPEVETFETSLSNLRDVVLQINENDARIKSDTIDAFTNGGFEESGDVTATMALNYGEKDKDSHLFNEDSSVVKTLRESGADEYSVTVYKPEDPKYDDVYVTLYLGNKMTDTSDAITAYKLIPCDWAEDDVQSFVSDFKDFCEISQELRQSQKGEVSLSLDDLAIDENSLTM